MKITGVHPYADEFPLASDDELAELTESISTVGLIQPLVVVGAVAGEEVCLLADGRNRRAACERAGVDPTVVVRDFDTDDELKEFVIGVNTTGRRESMTVQIAAASTALILGAEKRANGQWDNKGGRGKKRETTVSGLDDAGGRKALARCGLVLDILGRDGLERVRDGESLNSVYVEAEKARDAERERLDYEERLALEEDDARTFINENAPELAERVDGDDLESFVEARDLWNRRNREEAERLRRQEAKEEKDRKEREQTLCDLYTGMAEALWSIGTHGSYEDINDLMKDYRRDRLYPPQLEDKAFTVENLNNVARMAQMLIAWKESK